jgi:hypothetical protein
VADNYNPLNDPEFHALSIADKHAYLTANDPGYKALPAADQGAYLSYLGQPPQEAQDIEAGKRTFPQTMMDVANAPMRKVAELGGKLDIASGLKTPKEAEERVKPYGDVGTQVALTGLGGLLGKSVTGSELGAAGGRVLAQGGQAAAQAQPGERAREFLKGAETGAAGEATAGLTTGAARKALDPLGLIKAAKSAPQMAPRAGEKWVKTYQYGQVPGSTAPMLTKDVLENVQKRPGTLGQVGGGMVRAAYDTALDRIRQFMQGDLSKPGRNPQ